MIDSSLYPRCLAMYDKACSLVHKTSHTRNNMFYSESRKMPSQTGEIPAESQAFDNELAARAYRAP
jgi:hypothetical protein